MTAPLLTLDPFYPCCYRRARLHVAVGRSFEIYHRRCEVCGTTWSVRRESSTLGGFRTDRLVWLDTTPLLDTNGYGS